MTQQLINGEKTPKKNVFSKKRLIFSNKIHKKIHLFLTYPPFFIFFHGSLLKSIFLTLKKTKKHKIRASLWGTVNTLFLPSHSRKSY